MPEAEYCTDCGRMLDIACTCGLSFAEKMRGTAFRMGDWAPSRPTTWTPPKRDDD